LTLQQFKVIQGHRS